MSQDTNSRLGGTEAFMPILVTDVPVFRIRIGVSWNGAANATSFDIVVIGDPGSTTNPHPVFNNVTSPFFVPIQPGTSLQGWQSQYEIIAHGKSSQSSSTWSNVLGPPTWSLRIEPASVIGGSQNATGTVKLGDTFIPLQGLQIGIAAYLPGLQPQSFVQVPSQITVLPGSPPSASFPITTSVVPGLEDVEIQAYSPATALLGSAFLQLTRQIPPGAIVAVSVAPDNVNFGEQATGYVFIAAPTSPQNVVVILSSSQPSVASVPASITVPAGQTSNSFPVSVASKNPTKGRFVTVSISGSAGGMTSEFDLLVGTLPTRNPTL